MILQNLSRHLMTNPQRISLLLGGIVVCELNIGLCDPPTSPTNEKLTATACESIPIDAAPDELKRLTRSYGRPFLLLACRGFRFDGEFRRTMVANNSSGLESNLCHEIRG